ncbi:hypothetical protein [Cryptosporangium sp. NPDC051539]|uniref:hypothetical protein n=1 Tax=Cryptosporangium sp. NPDC051539 TaxID=3363962 RepID=UPI00379FC662
MPIRIRVLSRAALVGALLVGGIVAVPSGASADPPSVADGQIPVTRITAPFTVATEGAGSVLLDKTFSVPYVPQVPIVLSGRGDADARYAVDDILEITVVHLREPASSPPPTRIDFSNGCSGRITPSRLNEPFNLGALLDADGRNTVRFRIIDACGGGAGGSTGLYIDNLHLVQTAGDRSDEPGDLYTPGSEGSQRDLSCVLSGLGILPAGLGTEWAGPLYLDGKVTANARINTRDFFCGLFSAVVRLTVADTADGPYRMLDGDIVGPLPQTGNFRPAPLSADLLPGIHYYRLEITYYRPEIDKNVKTPDQEPSNDSKAEGSIKSDDAHSPAVQLIG